MYKFVIEGKLLSCNEYTNACRSKAYMGAKLKKEAQEVIGFYIKQQIPDVHIYGRVKLHFKWYEPNCRRDIDNVAFAKKFILDSLVENEVIPDDSQKYVTSFTDEIIIDRDNPRIEVELEEY